MTALRSTREDKLARLLQRADKGRAFHDLATDATVNEFFDGLETRLVNDIAADPSQKTADEIRALAIALNTTRTLRAFIKAAVAEGQRAEHEYAKLAGAKTNA